MAAVAADSIYVNESTMAGSIGVVANNKGYQELARKVGVENRVITAGDLKYRLDPFDALKEEDVLKMKEALEKIHHHFIETVIAGNDPWCRGIVMLGLDAPSEQLGDAFEAAKGTDMVKGCAVGRTIFMETARDWFENRVSDEQAIADMADRFSGLVERWKPVR